MRFDLGPPDRDPRRLGARSLLVFAVVIVAVVLAVHGVAGRTAPEEASYDQMLAAIRSGRVTAVTIGDEEISAELRQPVAQGEGVHMTARRLPGVDEGALRDELIARGITVRGAAPSPSIWISLASWLAVGAVIAMIVARRAPARTSPLRFGQARFAIHDANEGNKVTFADVAGVDEARAELAEVVSYLRAPDRLRKLGGRAPKGVLLVGAPGTGKTLLARAVAGEAGVPFFSTTGSEFVEMFVGVGASRVRDLFEQAKHRAPCIVFVDELDAIGRARGGLATLGTNEEREQTLNQLLVEMDGFEAGQGVVLIAATNRPELLDAALVRAGRFDRQVVVDRPDVRGREAILGVHARRVTLDAGVDLHVVAQRTPGMVGADLANIVNEAALCAARRDASSVTLGDFEDAIDRIQLGLKKRARPMNAKERERIAYHEAGHALVALSVEHADPVHRVTIIPRTIGALGATLQLPTEDRYLVTESELADQLCVMLGGRVAEELSLNEASNGAQNDLERATEIARQMVCRFGMSEKLGAVALGRSQSLRFLDSPFGSDERNYSEETARAIDREVRSIIDVAKGRAEAILVARRPALDRIARELLVRETLDHAELLALVDVSEAVAA